MRYLIALLFLCLSCAAAAAQERHVGYYYPEITSEEQFARVIVAPAPTDRDLRVTFVTGLTRAQLDAPESPRFVFFAKGAMAEDLIIVALDDEVFRTLYRARAVLAQMTSNIRSNGFLEEQGLRSAATFFDMLQLLEFDTLVISDGNTWSHKVTFERD